MARPVAKSSTPASAWSDIPALLMLGTGTLLYLALISYQPSDLPAWVPFSKYVGSEAPRLNFIGPVGAVVAGIHFFFFGAASFLVAALLLGFGAVKLFAPGVRVQRKLPWVALFVLCGACLAQLQPWFLHWNADFNAHGSGGLVGLWFIGTSAHDHVRAHPGLLPSLLGPAGTAIFLTVAYVCTLILMTGLHPVEQLARLIHFSRVSFTRWHEAYVERKFARASAHELLEMDRVQVIKEQRRLEKQLRKQGAAPLPADAKGDDALPLAPPAPDEFADLPAPKITDNSVPNPVAQPPKKKPSLAELLTRRGGKGAANGDPAAALGAGGEGDGRFANYELPEIDLLDTADMAGRVVADPRRVAPRAGPDH